MDITLLNIDPQVYAVLGLAVIATIKLIDQLFDRDFRGAAKILGAGLAGLALAFGIDGLTAVAGVIGGLASSGIITTVGYTKKTTPVDTQLG
jgi:hypothetical protein